MYSLPNSLHHQGHRVVCAVGDYHGTEPAAFPAGDLEWTSIPLKQAGFPRPDRYWRHARQTCQHLGPDCIWAGSDAFHLIAGHRLAARYRLPFVCDLKDNYEHFTLTRIPGLYHLYLRALRAATAITCASEPLIDYARARSSAPTVLIPNAAPAEFARVAQTRDARDLRHLLGLPTDTPLLGTTGALTRRRGIGTITEGMDQLASSYPDACLVTAGRPDEHWTPPSRAPHVHLGELPYDRIPYLLAALDIGIICNQDNKFGRYCYPQKYSEMLATGLPMIVAKTGIFSNDDPATGVLARFEPGSPEDFARAAVNALQQAPRHAPTGSPSTWNERGALLQHVLTRST